MFLVYNNSVMNPLLFAQVKFPRFLEEDRALFEGLLPENTVVSP